LDRLVIAVTGTPGTGKSVFARKLAKKVKASLVDLNELITEKKIYRLDADGTKIADLAKMRREFSRTIEKIDHVVVEGVLAHLLPKKLVTHVVVLRTRPRTLEKRLHAKKFSKKKIRENVEAEALDVILWEAVNIHGIDRVYEIDTTKLRPTSAVELFLKALKGKTSLEPGKISWLEEVF